MTVLITGASTGIGFEFAKQLTSKYDLVLVSQNKKRLSAAEKKIKEMAGQKVYSLPLDLKDPLSINKVSNFLKKKKLKIDFLINNAGVGFFGGLEKMSDKEISDLLDLNVKSLTLLTKLVLPSMIKQRSGKIVNISSAAAFQPLPYFGVYSASKAYVLNFTEALGRELEGYNIKVLAVCPGATNTEFANRASSKVEWKEQSSLLNIKSNMDSNEVVSLSLKALDNDRKLIITGWQNYFRASISRFLPRTWTSKVSKDLMAKVMKDK